MFSQSSLFSALGHLLLPKQRVDQAGLANIGVAKGADSQHFPLLILRVKYYIYISLYVKENIVLLSLF